MGWCHFHDCEYMFVFFFLRFIEIYLNVVNNISKSHPDRERYRCSKCHHIHENICCDEYQTPNFVPLFCSALIILPVDHFSFLETDIPTISSHLPYASSKNQSTIESEMGKKKRYPIYENLNSNDPCDLFELVWAFSSSFYLVQPFLLSNFQHFLHSSNFFLVLMLPHLLFGSHKLSQNSQACDTIKCGELNSLPAIS